jgi:hypothetical protein
LDSLILSLIPREAMHTGIIVPRFLIDYQLEDCLNRLE